MKKHLFLVVGGVLGIASLPAQTVVRNANGSYYKQCAKFKISEPLWKIAQEYPATQKFDKVREAADGRSPVSKSYNETYNPDACTVDGALQSTPGTIQNKPTLVSVNGASGQGYIPLDPNGMIGSNYYVQTINSEYAIYNKNGTVKLAGTDLAKLFGSFTCDDGDPVTMYDKFADRWIITEFQENGSCGSNDAIDTMMMAVSQTNDPTGKYYLYYFCPDNADFADYPKYSIWADGYYQTCNCQNDKVVVYDRTKMLAGNPAAGFIVIPFNGSPWNSGGQGGFFCPMTMYADGQLPPYGSANYLLYFDDDNWGSSFKDQIVIDSISVNWTAKTGTLSACQTLATAPFDSYFSGGKRTDIDEPGQSGAFDALDGFFSYRIPYLRWTGYNDAVMCYPVNISSTPTSPGTSGGTEVAGIRWYELRQDLSTKKWSIYQQGTYGPSDGISRWNPAIAMDQNGSIGLAYSVSSSSVSAGIRYTGRTACDPLGTMTLTEGIGASGSGTINETGINRWGDYSHTSVDPSDGITFWHTNMYSSSGSLATRIFSWQITPCNPTGVVDVNLPQTELSAYQTGSTLNVKAIKLPNTQNVEVDIFDINGKSITGKTVPASSSTLETSFNVSSLAKGIYFVRIGNDSFQRVVKVAIN